MRREPKARAKTPQGSRFAKKVDFIGVLMKAGIIKSKISSIFQRGSRFTERKLLKFFDFHSPPFHLCFGGDVD